MENSVYKQTQTIFSTITSWTFLAMMLLFPLTSTLKNFTFAFVIFLSIWTLKTLINKDFLYFDKPNKTNIFLYFQIGLICWMMLSGLWVENRDLYSRHLSIRIPILLISINLLCSAKRTKFNFELGLLLFVIGTYISTLMAFGFAYFESKNRGWLFVNETLFTLYCEFKHRTFFGMTQLISIASFFYYQNYLLRFFSKKTYYVLLGLLTIFFLGAIFISQGRMILIISIILLTILFLYSFKNFKYRNIFFAIGVCFLLGGLYSLKNHPRIEQIEFSKEGIMKADPRIEHYICAYECVKEINPFVGVGMGDRIQLFKAKYETTPHTFGIFDSAHNEWIDGLLEYGLIGILLLLSFFVSLFLGVKKDNEKLLVANLGIIWLLFIMIEPLYLRSIPVIIFSISIIIIYLAKIKSLEK
jgi:hypothetical protein